MSEQITTPLDSKEVAKRKRERLAIVLLTLMFIALSFAEFRLTRLSATLPFVNSIFFFGLLNVNIIILIALVWLVFRNIGKLFIERRRKIMGSRLKTKLVIAFLGFSIVPTLLLFVISAMYINSSFDKWFSIKIQNTLQASLEITHVYYRNVDENAMHFASHLSADLGKRLASSSPDRSGWIQQYLESQRDLLALDAVEYYSDPLDERVLAQHFPNPDQPDIYPRLSLELLDRAFGGERVSVMQHIGTGDLIRCLVPVHAGGVAGSNRPIVGVISVNDYIPVSLANKVDEIASVLDDYKGTNPLKYPMKTTYLVILIMITLVVIFVGIWMGLYLARELTIPVELLVRGAHEVGSGNLDIAVARSGHDEISVLVESFNKMTRDLKDNRARLTQASADLEKRRLQLEAVLANIGTGVIAVDRSGEITTFNRAVAHLLEIEPVNAIGKRYGEVLGGEALPLAELISHSFENEGRNGNSVSEATQWNLKSVEGARALAATATPLRESDADWGVVVVIDDLTHIIKGQREMAWREVARRIAHEIKNPLTPIKLSAQRLQRRLGSYRGRDGALLQECTDTIIKHTDELKEMVNEFSNFARFPEASPAPHDLNAVLREVITLYQQAHPGIGFKFDAETRLPIFDFDRDQIKRVMINLLDNAVAALQPLPVGRPRFVVVMTHFNDLLQMAAIVIQDNGPGMTEDVKARVFEPYFSTKTEGTGLGLAIAKRIVNDHDGFIRVHSAPGEGTQFLIELPTAVRHGLDQHSQLATGPVPPLEH